MSEGKEWGVPPLTEDSPWTKPIEIPQEIRDSIPEDFGRSKGLSWYFLRNPSDSRPPIDHGYRKQLQAVLAMTIRGRNKRVPWRVAKRMARDVMHILMEEQELLLSCAQNEHESIVAALPRQEREIHWDSSG